MHDFNKETLQQIDVAVKNLHEEAGLELLTTLLKDIDLLHYDAVATVVKTQAKDPNGINDYLQGIAPDNLMAQAIKFIEYVNMISQQIDDRKWNENPELPYILAFVFQNNHAMDTSLFEDSYHYSFGFSKSEAHQLSTKVKIFNILKTCNELIPYDQWSSLSYTDRKDMMKTALSSHLVKSLPAPAPLR